MRGRRAEERLGQADLPLPSGGGQVVDARGPVPFGDEPRVDQEDAGPGGEAVPGAVLGLERVGDVVGARRAEGFEQTLLP